jgi:hypothetical protein
MQSKFQSIPIKRIDNTWELFPKGQFVYLVAYLSSGK